MGAGGMLGQ
jgi:CCR4-NOT transcription complex subunit 1